MRDEMGDRYLSSLEAQTRCHRKRNARCIAAQ